ncbi:hypothetical protein F4821DRAFT_23082 [Hypoxylon rubiginosum]|uniref:Uncharacterized protein n=1 Tax=Hypoxylon rubiginosum TaxID=110542 RepID=A0ACC0CMU8_9PEZI|nr:hypothetical protein F4821DRAFT_23082 [Hypoxylon rubiginosum]
MSTFNKSAKENYSVCILMICLTAVATLTRLFTKLLLHQKPSGADWMCLLGLCFFFAYCSCVIYHISRFHSIDLDLTLGQAQFLAAEKMAYITEIIYTFGITSVKISLLWYYHIIFAVDRILRWSILATGIACLLWFLVFLFVIVFQCKPIDAVWTHFNVKGYCIQASHFLLAYELTNLFLDVAILCIPIGAVSKLQLRLSKKLTVIGIFLLGAFVCVVSILRLTAIWVPPYIRGDFSRTFLWSTMQLGIAIICSCLPTYGPLISSLSRSLPSIRSLFTSNKSQATESRTPMRRFNIVDRQSAPQTYPEARDQFSSTAQCSAHTRDGSVSDNPINLIPQGGILLSRSFEVRTV